MEIPNNTPEQETELVRTLIIDDHDHIRELVHLYLMRYFADVVKVVGAAKSFKSATALLQEVEADLVFLDIDLTDGTGFEALDTLTPEVRERFQVIVISTLQERKYVKQAIQYGALDFIDKPILATEFKAAVERAIEVISKIRSIKERLKAVPQKRAIPTSQPGIIEVRMMYHNQVKILMLPVKDIVYAQAARNTCTIVMQGGTVYIPSVPLKHYEKAFTDDGCVRIGRGYVINPVHVPLRLTDDEDETIEAVLPSGEVVPVEPKYREIVQELLQ